MKKELLTELMNAHKKINDLLMYDPTIPILVGLKDIQTNLFNIQKIIANGND